MRRDAALPQRCIHCNVAAVPGKEQRLYFLNLWIRLAMILLLLVFNVLALIPIYIASLIFRKTVKLGIPICGKHRNRRQLVKFLVLGFLISSIAIAYFAARAPGYSDVIFVISATIFAVAFMLAIIRGQLLRAKKIDQEIMILKGAKLPFLDSLPDYPGQ